jgi:hypothetical protein
MAIAMIPKLIKALLDFKKMMPEQLLAMGYAILKALTGNANFPTAPFDLGQFKTVLDTYAVLIGDAKDGGKKAITARDKQGAEVIRILRAIAMYVELNCKDDMNTFLSSGFQPRSRTRTPAGPLEQPTIQSVDQGVSSEFMVWIKSVGRSAKSYDVRTGVVGAGGATPTTWSTVTVPNTRTAARINGLTPGTTYAIQVRAYGSHGYTAWSDSSIRMCI